MYQFTTTTVINSALDSNGTTAKFSGSATAFTVTRVNTFKKDNIVSIYKKAYAAGVKEVGTIVVPTITQGLVARLVIDVRLSQQTDSEYANSYLYFKKPIVVEILASGTAATDATALVAQINGLKDRFGSSYITAANSSTATITITATNTNQRFYSFIIEKEKASTNSIIQPEYEVANGGILNGTTAVNNAVLTTLGKTGFGDDEYMIKSIMIPTLENTRYFGINKEERPIIGGNYSEYVLRYSITKDGNDGIVSGGTSVTTHVFYVLSSLVPDFEAAIIAAGKTITSFSAEQTFTLGKTGDTTAEVSVDISAIVPFILSSAEITATSSAVGKATIGAITVNAPTGTPVAQTASIALTKVAAGATTITVVIDGVSASIGVTIG